MLVVADSYFTLFKCELAKTCKSGWLSSCIMAGRGYSDQYDFTAVKAEFLRLAEGRYSDLTFHNRYYDDGPRAWITTENFEKHFASKL